MITIFTLYSISWKQFIIGISIITLVYYVVIAMIYYKDNIRQLISGEASMLSRLLNKSAVSANKPGNDIKSSMDDNLYNIIEQLVDRIKKPIERAGKQNCSKEELIFALRNVLTSSTHPLVNYSFLKSGINELISAECEKKCSIQLTEADLDLLWTK